SCTIHLVMNTQQNIQNLNMSRDISGLIIEWKLLLNNWKSIHAIIIVSYLTRYLKIIAQDKNLSCRTLKTSIMFSVYAEKRNLIESTKEFNWKNRRIGVIFRDADVVVY
ncbi:hypothetical protein L9F63_000829, partial [Diploptera punctata]